MTCARQIRPSWVAQLLTRRPLFPGQRVFSKATTLLFRAHCFLEEENNSPSKCNLSLKIRLAAYPLLKYSMACRMWKIKSSGTAFLSKENMHTTSPNSFLWFQLCMLFVFEMEDERRDSTQNCRRSLTLHVFCTLIHVDVVCLCHCN